MNRCTFLLIPVLILTTISPGFTQDSSFLWTPEQCLSYAFEHNPDIVKARNTIASDSIRLLQARSQLFPSVSAGADYSYAWTTTTGSNATSGNSSSIGASASANLTLFNGGIKRLTIKQYLLAETSDSASYRSARLSLTENILSAYLQSLYFQEYKTICQAQSELSKQQSDVAHAKLELKTITNSEFLQFATEESSSNLNVIKANNQYELSILQLSTLIHLPQGKTVTPISPETWSNKTNNSDPDFDSVYRVALINRPEIAAEELQMKIQELNLRMAKAERLPKISAQVSTGWNQDLLSSNATGGINASAGISISVPIFDQRQVNSNIGLAQISVRDQQLSYESSLYELRTTITEILQNISSAQSELESAEKQLELAEETYRSALESFTVGKMAPIDLLNQKTELSNAKYNVLKARYSLILDKLILQLYINPDHN
jgi:outer membrane protein